MIVVVGFVINPFLGTCLCEILRHGAVHERLTLLARWLEFEKLHTHYILCIINYTSVWNILWPSYSNVDIVHVHLSPV